ncbi:MAG TPA: hypothetical protein VHI52_16710 [Verrucomicrobiae bacterium]|nr:hypothetical protein [Verrucomicrobiae bacterium]
MNEQPTVDERGCEIRQRFPFENAAVLDLVIPDTQTPDLQFHSRDLPQRFRNRAGRFTIICQDKHTLRKGKL